MPDRASGIVILFCSVIPFYLSVPEDSVLSQDLSEPRKDGGTQSRTTHVSLLLFPSLTSSAREESFSLSPFFVSELLSGQLGGVRGQDLIVYDCITININTY